MAELKTKRTEASVDDFIAGIADEQRREDCRTLLAMMKRVTKAPPKMWGASMVGFGSYRYRYASGREGDWFLAGFSPRKQDLTVYVLAGFEDYPELMARLGKYRTGKSCLYLKRLSDVDAAVLEKLIAASVKDMKGHDR
jgi:hypothetical protein